LTNKNVQIPPPHPIIVLLEHRPDYCAIYGMNLTLYMGADVRVANTIKEVVDLVQAEKVSLIFVNNNAYTQDISLKLWNIFESKQIKTPLFVMGNSGVPQEHVTLFDSNIELKYVLQSIAKQINITAKDMIKRESPEYFPLPMEFMVPGWLASIDIYSLVSGSHEIVFKKDDVILEGTLEELEHTNNFQLYVKKNHRLKFVNNLTNQISAKLNDPNLSAEDRCKVTATGYQMVMEQARKIGIGESTMELANSCIKSMIKLVEMDQTLDSLLDNLMSSTDSYRYKHSLLINYIGSHIIKKIPWGNKEQQEKFAFVSFFHNITLTKDEYVMITSESQLAKSNLSPKEKELISKHALLSAKILGKNKDIPYGAEVIIKQHHGSKDGVGLSKISMAISPLAIIFMFAEEWANIILKTESKSSRPNKKEVIMKLHQKYNIPAFNKILPILHTLEL